jgi:putative SOS response-associated peptidase YedK
LPASAFIEWRKVGGRAKQRVKVALAEGRPFAMAGLWNRWQGNLSCTILTTSANELMVPIHNRMPVILPHSLYSAWLSPEPIPITAVQSMLTPYDSTDMSAVDEDTSPQGSLF